MLPRYETKRILIWGKTYPELSTKHIETVCTGGVLEDGSPVRIYPIPYRYANTRDQYKKYQWITAPIARNESDPRPESYKIDFHKVELGEAIPTDKNEWSARAEVLFKNKQWVFDSVDDLLKAQATKKTSLGVVIPKEIIKVSIVERPKDSLLDFNQRIEKLRKDIKVDQNQLKLFEEITPREFRHLDYISHRININWRCNDHGCKSHHMQILDWELCELQRKSGDEKAKNKIEEICNLETHATKFFLGNMFRYPQSFTIVGFWYPKKSATVKVVKSGQENLFDLIDS